MSRAVRAAALAAILLGAVPALLPAGAARAQEAGPAAGQPADPVAEARALRKEAKDLFKTAGDADLPRDERKKARQGAYSRLQKARDLLDGWLEAHPEDAEKLDDLYSDIATTMYWLRKEGGIGEFDPPGSKPAAAPPPVEPAPPAPATPPGEAAPAAPAPPSPAALLAGIREYERRHPGDVPGLHDRYSKFLADCPDRTAPEYAEALRSVEELGKRLKDVYRLARDDDPDALGSVDEGDVGRLVDQLSSDLKSPDAAVRARAARFLGGLGSGKAAPAMVEALAAEQDGSVQEALVESLSRIGGRRVCQRLVREKPGSPLAPMVVDILCRMAKRGGVSGRIAGESVADYVAGMDGESQRRAAEVLFEAGADGAVGLSKLVDLAPADRKVPYIEHLGDIREPRTAGNLARFLIVNAEGSRRAQHMAALTAILKIGKPGVRYLIPVLDEKDHAVWTAEMLHRITGTKPKDDSRKAWEKWYRQNRRALEE